MPYSFSIVLVIVLAVVVWADWRQSQLICTCHWPQSRPSLSYQPWNGTAAAVQFQAKTHKICLCLGEKNVRVHGVEVTEEWNSNTTTATSEWNWTEIMFIVWFADAMLVVAVLVLVIGGSDIEYWTRKWPSAGLAGGWLHHHLTWLCALFRVFHSFLPD